MKNKFKPFDITIVSVYMGRFLTGIVAAVVLAITIHALATRPGHRNRAELAVAVAAHGDAEATRRFYEPLRRIIASRTTRPVRLVTDAGAGRDACELFIVPSVEFLSLREKLGLTGLFALDSGERDRAVIIARGDANVDIAEARADDVVFVAPESMNGCWVQLRELARRGMDLPTRLDGLHFAAAAADVRVVFSVVDGAYSLGACRARTLAALVERGALARNEVRTVLQAPALPETVVAARAADAGYFVDELGRLEALFDDPVSALDRYAVELLRERGLAGFRPLSPDQGDDLAAVFEFVSKRR